MAYRGSLFLLTLVVISAPAGPLAAHQGDRLFPIVYLSEETLALLDRNDAHVEDWVDVVGEPTLTPLDFTLDSERTNTSYGQFDPSNLNFRIWVGWSSDGRIHFAGQFADDVYETEHGNVDSITLRVDGDHTGGEYLSGPSPMQAQNYRAISRAPSGLPLIQLSHAYEEDANVEWITQPPFASVGGSVFGENPTNWVVEFFVTCFDRMNHLSPEGGVVSQFDPGRIIGLDIGVVDRDDPNSSRYASYRLVDENLRIWGKGADNFTDGLLLGPDDDFANSAVQSTSWARIKASLETDFRNQHLIPEND